MDAVYSCIRTKFVDGIARKNKKTGKRMLELHRRLPTARSPQEKEMLQREIESTDAAVDGRVYQLYGLTEEEIGIVEG